MRDVLTEFDDELLLREVDANFEELIARMMVGPDVKLYDDSAALRWEHPVPHPLLNGVGRIRYTGSMADDWIEEVLAPYRERGVPCMWNLGPETTPSDLGERLNEHGVMLADAPAAMVMSLDELRAPATPASGVELRRVRTEDDLDAYCDALERGFELEPDVRRAFQEIARGLGLEENNAVRNYVALQGGVPVAGSTVYLSGVAGIYNVATAPEARRQGIGAAVTHVALFEARAAGCRAAVLKSSTMAEPVYASLGFREVARVAMHIWMPGATSIGGA